MTDLEYKELAAALRRENAMWIKVDGYMPPWSVLITAIIALPILMNFV